MPEKFFLTYTNATAVPYQGSVLGRHIVLNYIDSNGDHHTLQGMPEHGFDHNIDKLVAFGREEMFSDGAANRDSPFQRLRTKAKRDRDVSLNQPHTMVAEGDDLSSRWALMQDFADEVNSIGYEYRPISQNSNSFAGGALQRAGFFGPGNEFPERFDSQLVFDPAGGETRSFNVPGFKKPLANPINTATPMPFPLGAPGAPFVPTNGFSAFDRPDSLDDRFGKWGSSPVPDRPVWFDNRFGNWGAAPAGSSGDTRSPVLRALQNYKRSAAPNGPVPTSTQGAPQAAPNLPIEESAFGDRSENATGAPRPDINSRRVSYKVSSAFPNITPRNPDEVAPPPERAPLLGIFSGKPMPLSRLPASVWGLPDTSDASGDGNSFNFLAGLAFRNPTQPAPPLQTNSKPVRSLGRKFVGQPPATMVDTRAPAAPLAPSDDPNFSGGLLGRFAALAGIDPQNPNQTAPLDDEQEQADMRALDARLSSSGNIRDAVALYNARKSSRR